MSKKIRMLVNKDGSEDGVNIKTFNDGQTYIMADSLAGVFIENKWAKDMETPENLEIDRKRKINKLIKKLKTVCDDCLLPDLDSVQIMEKIAILKSHPVIENSFQEKLEAAEKIKAAGIKTAEKSLKALNKANANLKLDKDK